MCKECALCRFAVAKLECRFFFISDVFIIFQLSLIFHCLDTGFFNACAEIHVLASVTHEGSFRDRVVEVEEVALKQELSFHYYSFTEV